MNTGYGNFQKLQLTSEQFLRNCQYPVDNHECILLSAMRLSSWTSPRRDDSEQFIYNWLPTPEDDLALDQGNVKEEQRTRGKVDKLGSHAISRYS